MDILALCLAAFAAGFMDAVAGGGGLIQVPALFALLPGAPPAALLGTNKLSSLAGTASAALRYVRHFPLAWSTAGPAAATALLTAALGASAVSSLPAGLVRPLVLALLIGVALYTWLKPEIGKRHAPTRGPRGEGVAATAAGGGIGFYDGFFGPGTGGFLIFAYVRLLGFDFLRAGTLAKVVNTATNLGALIWFAASGNVIYEAALPMALCNVLGAQAGARAAIRGGSRLIRRVFLAVVWLLIGKLGYDLQAG